MKPLGEPVHQLHDLLSWQASGLFNNLIQRHRHGIKLPTTGPKLKREAEILRLYSSRNPRTRKQQLEPRISRITQIKKGLRWKGRSPGERKRFSNLVF